jgi:hypothetical protein
MEREITTLLKRARTVLARHEGPLPGGRIMGALEPAEILALSRPVFYELGVAATEDGPIGRVTLKLAGPDTSSRVFRIGIFVSKGALHVATRWSPREARPLVLRGAATAEGWSAAQLEHALEKRVQDGIASFEQDIARGKGHLESSGDLLGLNG